MRFAIFPVHVSKVLRLPRKSEARSYEVLHLSRKIILENLKISRSKMQPLSGNLRPDLLTHLLHVTLVLRLPRDIHLSRSSSNVPRLPSFLTLLQSPHVLLTFHKVQNPLRLPRKTTSERPKVLRTPQFYTFDLEMCFAPQRRSLFQHLNCQKCSEAEVLSASRHSGVHFFDLNFQKCSECRVLMRVLCMWASKCASRHNGVRFFNFSTSKSASNPSVFNTFDFEICFAPQRRALFRHINLPKVVREWCALDILTSKCASRHNGVHFFNI